MHVTARDRTAAVLGRRFVDLRRPSPRPSRVATPLPPHQERYDGTDVATGLRVALVVPSADAPDWVADALLAQAHLLGTVGPHPHVVTLHEVWRLPDGRPVLVLDHTPQTLADRVERMPVTEAATIGIALASALEAVHAAGWVHADVRPGTVGVTDTGVPLLTAFDEAAPLDDTTPRPPRHVTTVHTAPEVLEGAPPTPRTDVYGLGATLYELVAGHAAFRAYAGESPAATVLRVLNGTARPAVVPGVPLAVSDLVTWAMAPDPARRPPSPAWIGEELARLRRELA